jgi:glycosyltransferase involved in cell wall biosynthesis
VPVTYLAVPTLPLLTNWIDPLLWARASQATVEKLIGRSRSDVIIDAHFLYPDAVAAVILGRRLGLPVVMTARGSDVNVKCENTVMRRWVCWAARHCAALITVSQALADKLLGYGVAADVVHTLPNGVDLTRFRPRENTRQQLDLPADAIVFLSAGHLLPGKGHHIAIEALSGLPDVTLIIVGQGPEEQALRNLAARLGVASRVRFPGFVPHEKMVDFYSAADVTILASANEGMPNVMLESLACGTRVIATDVGGVSEVLTAPVAGAVMTSRSAAAVQESYRGLLARDCTREATRAFAKNFGWSTTIQRQLALFDGLMSR